MRKFQQKQILELLATLAEAHEEIRRQNDPQIMTSLLGECQDFAVQIGEFIEQLEGEGTKTVSLLEDYHEMLYKASVDSNISRHIKVLNRHLDSIKRSVEEELKPDKVVMVFFPYKASMFDSF